MNAPTVSSSEKEPAIFLSTNRRYRGYVNNLINSIIAHNPNHPDILVAVTRDVQDGDIDVPNNRVHLVENTMETEKLSALDYHPKDVNPASYYGRIMPIKDNRRFQKYGNILYLDADTIVCGDLHPLLMKTDFFQVASPDVLYHPFHSIDNHTIRDLCWDHQKHKLKPQVFGNSGVILMPDKVRTDKVFDELMRIQESYGDHFRWADQSLLAFWMAKHQIQPSEESQWNYMGPDYRRFARESSEMRYKPVKPHEAVVYHINNGHSPRKGLFEAQMVAKLGARVTMKVLSALRA